LEKRKSTPVDSDTLAVPLQPAVGIQNERAERVSQLDHAL
jgi:hypothetical protein